MNTLLFVGGTICFFVLLWLLVSPMIPIRVPKIGQDEPPKDYFLRKK